MAVIKTLFHKSFSLGQFIMKEPIVRLAMPYKTIDITTRLRGINSTTSIVYSPEPRAEVYCLTLNFKIAKLGFCRSEFIIKFIFEQ